jgi:sulfite exporter TauE/SafE
MVMCGPQYSIKSSSEKAGYLLGRFFSYSFFGGLFGYFGQSLYSFLELEILKTFSFLVYVGISILVLLSWFGIKLQIVPKNMATQAGQSKFPSFFHGLFSVALPCSIIYQMIGLCILTKSLYGGLLIGSISSFITGFSLWLSTSIVSGIQKKALKLRKLLRVIVILLIIFSLFQFFVKAYKPFSEENLSPLQKEILCL